MYTFSLVIKWSKLRSRSCQKPDRSSILFIFFALPRTPVIFQEPLMLSESTLQMQIAFNHPVIVSSPLISQSFSLRKPTGADSAPLTVITGNRKRAGRVYLRCIVAVWVHSNWCLVWAWKRWAYGTPSSAMQYSKRSYIIHLFFPLRFWRAILKVSLADPFNLTSLWSWSAKSWRLGFETSHGTGWYWDDNEALFSKEWMN